MDQTLFNRLERCKTLPTLPAVALRVVQLCQEEDLSVTELVSTLSTDPALAAKILKMVNSAAYNRRTEVSTLSQAVVILGTNALRALALSFSLVPDTKSSQSASRETFWKRAVFSAIGARELSKVLRFPMSEEAFLCGLLQDLGILAMNQALGADYEVIQQHAGNDNEALSSLERIAFGADHAEIGEWLLKQWKLPAVMQTAAAYSHCPSRLPAETDLNVSTLAKVTAASGLLADIWLREDKVSATERAKLRVVSLFQLQEGKLKELLDRIANAMPEVAALFELDLGSGQDLASVLEEAKETLLMLNMQASEQFDKAQKKISTLEEKADQLTLEAQRDALTGLSNRRRLERYLEEQFSLAFRSGRPLTVIMCDLDHFKKVNDTHGHLGGDTVLKAVSGILGAKMRPRDLTGRYGGEEFVLVLPETHFEGGFVVSERLRKAIEELEIHVGTQQIKVTLSLGYATFQTGDFSSHSELLRAADEALYMAKQTGRNKTIGWKK